jgi:hypothetical protein
MTLRDFWFGRVDLTGIGLMRICTGVIVAWMLFERVPEVRSTYSDEAWLSADAAATLMDSAHTSLFRYITDPAWVAATMVLGGCCALLFASGTWTRLPGIVAFVILCSVHVRNPKVLYGADSTARIFLFYLLLIPSNRCLSIDRWRRQKSPNAIPLTPASSTCEAWPVRLLQIQVCLIYLASGISKSYGTDYSDGSALWYALGNPTFSRFYPFAMPLFEVITGPLVIMSKLTLWWELAFAFLVPFRRLRPWVLGYGVVVHGGIWVMLKIEFWGPIMLISYLALIKGEQVRCFLETLARRYERSPG